MSLCNISLRNRCDKRRMVCPAFRRIRKFKVSKQFSFKAEEDNLGVGDGEQMKEFWETKAKQAFLKNQMHLEYQSCG